MQSPKTTPGRRHKSYNDSHQEMIETAVRLISERGVGALSISAVARSMGIDRTTVYYHFDGLEALIAAVKAWSSEQLAKAFKFDATLEERIDYTTRYVLENPELMKLWMDDFISGNDIRKSYPYWDAMVEGMTIRNSRNPDDLIDAEIYYVNLLTSAIIGPRVFKNSVCPTADAETIVRRFRAERLRLLKESALLQD